MRSPPKEAVEAPWQIRGAHDGIEDARRVAACCASSRTDRLL